MKSFGHEINPGEIIIKSVDVFRAVLERHYSPLLIDIECDMARDYGVVLTSAYRENDKGVHGCMRGLDNRSWCYPEKQAYAIMQEINQRWEYDPERPDKMCSMIHSMKNGGIHFHNQVHPNTRRRIFRWQTFGQTL